MLSDWSELGRVRSGSESVSSITQSIVSSERLYTVLVSDWSELGRVQSASSITQSEFVCSVSSGILSLCSCVVSVLMSVLSSSSYVSSLHVLVVVKLFSLPRAFCTSCNRQYGPSTTTLTSHTR